MKHGINSPTLPSLFLHCFILSLVTFGGGSTIISMLQKQFVEKLGWIDETEMLELLTLAQSSPGATSVNTAMLIGYRLFGLRGALASAAGSALPPLAIICVISLFYDQIRSGGAAINAFKGVRACAAALVLSVSLSLSISLFKKKDYFTIIIWAGAAVAAVVFRMNAIFLILAGFVVGILRFILFTRRRKQVNL